MFEGLTTLQVRQDATGAVTIGLARPDRFNAIGTTMAGEFTAVAEGFAGKFGPDSPRPCTAVVLAAEPRVSRGTAIAIAGGDLKELHALNGPEDVARYSGQLQAFCSFLEELPVPVVGRVTGGLIGGGAELFLACDLIYATAASFFWFKQNEVGLPTGYGGGLRLAEQVGVATASQWLFDPVKISAEAALAAGLGQKVLPDEAALDHAIAERLAFWQSLPRPLVAAQKAMLTAGRHPDRKALLAKEQELFISQWRNPYHSAKLDGFNQKS